MSRSPEWEQVGQPMLKQLQSLGWETLVWSERRHSLERRSSRGVLLEQRLHRALKKINRGPDGGPWLDGWRIGSTVADLRTPSEGASNLLKANRHCTGMLLDGTTVAGLDGWDGGRDRIVDYIDWDDWEANDFLAVSHFTVAAPGRMPDVRPDVTLFVNGIPLVVVEAKSPGYEGGIADAIDQIRRYTGQPGGAASEGAERLFQTNQLTVVTTGERAAAATFSALPEHYTAWKDPYPAEADDIAAALGKTADTLTQQELLVAGMLAPQRLLDIVRHFTLFMDAGPGHTAKVVARYQQYRCVQRALRKLTSGDIRMAGSHPDRRGGIVWHTQGSGKSLTMVFLIRAMRYHPRLRRFKVVLVTDRADLERQLRRTAALTGETVDVARSANDLRGLLSRPGPGLVMAMIQKCRDIPDGEIGGPSSSAALGTLNDSSDILVIVDEAHRSHGSTLHTNLMAAVPNAARIGFTGTPIIMGKRKKTLEIFGDYLDRYTLRESEADGSIVPILYEGRTTDAAVRGASKMDELFFRWFSGLDDDQREAIQQKHTTMARVMEAPDLIAAKADDMLRHYVSTVMPDGFKGMIVASSREACLRYRDALNAARDSLVAELEKRLSDGAGDDGLSGGSASAAGTAGSPSAGSDESASAAGTAGSRDADESFLRDAVGRLSMIRALQFAPVISADYDDPPRYTEWTDKRLHRKRIDEFKLPLGVDDGDGCSPLALLIVKSMLLTGFDVPQAQAIYLDRMIQEAELLQAVARVNRPAPKKAHGLLIDYYGVSAQLTEALNAYVGGDGRLDPDVESALRPLTTEIDKLEPQRQRLRQLFVQRGAEPSAAPDAVDACVQLLADKRLRTEFDAALKTFLTTFDTILPRPEARPHTADAKLFGEVQIRAWRRYRGTTVSSFDPCEYKEKVRHLLDQHITALDLSRKIKPTLITVPGFTEHINGTKPHRSRASEMEHAKRFHILQYLDENPDHYEKLSQRIDGILCGLKSRWDQIALEFQDLSREIQVDRNSTGLNPHIELPFHDLMADRVASWASGSDTDPVGPVVADSVVADSVVADSVITAGPVTADRLAALTRELVADIRLTIGVVRFWDNSIKQDHLRKNIKCALDASDLFHFNSLDELSVELAALARANQSRMR